MEQFTETSCLSDGVYQIICGLNLEYTKSCKRKSVNDELHWIEREVLGSLDDRVKHLYALAKLCLTKNSDGITFTSTVKQLIPFCHNIHKQLMQLDYEEFEEKFGMDLEWTGFKKRIGECFKLLKSGDQDPVNIILSCLLLFSMLERSLGDVYISHTGLKCPSSLKDLFMSKGIQELLGEDLCLILYTLAGPPEGLNLRNVLWHGFVSVNEIPPQYISFLLFTIMTISSRFASVQIERRPMSSLIQSNVPCIFPNIDFSKCLSAVDQLFNSSSFMTSSTFPVWKKALECYKQQRHDLVVVLLLPLLEHAMRRAFAYANQCPQRILTAESTTLYTTFDEILAPSLSDGTENNLRKVLGDEYLQMLLDMLIYTEGPRLRDRISHGEVDLDCMPSEMSNHVLCICIAFASLFSLGPEGNHFSTITSNLETAKMSLPAKDTTKYSQLIKKSSKTSVPTNNLKGTIHQCCSNISISEFPDTIQQINFKARNYHSFYHPTEILKTDMRELSEVFDKWDQILLQETNLTVYPNQAETKENILKMISTFCVGVVDDAYDLEVLLVGGQVSKGISLICEKVQVPTLYRPRKELEIVALFNSIVQHCRNASVQIMDTANQRFQQWSRKELRSRQRTNYKRLLSLLPFFQNLVEMVLVFILIELPSLQENAAASRNADYIKFLKRCLQYSENLDSLSSITKNKWDECKVVGEQLIHIIQRHLYQM